MINEALEGITDKKASGWLQSLAGYVLPGFVVTAGTAVLSEKYGDEVPDFLKPAAEGLASFGNMCIDFIRGMFFNEELEANKGLEEQFAKTSALKDAAAAIGGDSASREALVHDLTEIINRRIRKDTGFMMSVDKPYAAKAALELRDTLASRLVKEFKAQNKDWKESDLEGFNQKAVQIAAAITGVTANNADDINLNTANKGYLGALLQTQEAVASEGKMQASFVKPINITDAVAEQVLAATPRGVSEAPEGGAPTKGKDKGPKVTGIQM